MRLGVTLAVKAFIELNHESTILVSDTWEEVHPVSDVIGECMAG